MSVFSTQVLRIRSYLINCSGSVKSGYFNQIIKMYEERLLWPVVLTSIHLLIIFTYLCWIFCQGQEETRIVEEFESVPSTSFDESVLYQPIPQSSTARHVFHREPPPSYSEVVQMTDVRQRIGKEIVNVERVTYSDDMNFEDFSDENISD